LAGIRPLEESDIPQAAALHQRVFEIPSTPDIGDRYRSYFTDKFLLPVRQGALPSLVFEDEDRKIVGFLAVSTRWFAISGKPIRAAVSSQFAVDRQARSHLVGVALSRHFLCGPQDLSFTDEASDASQSLWEKMGGTTAPMYSMHWIAPLRPANLALSTVVPRLGSFARLATPVADLMDGIVSRIPYRGRPRPQSSFHAEPLSTKALVDFMMEPLDDARLRPFYEVCSLDRILDEASRKKAHGAFQRILLRGSNGKIAGWYLYYLNRRGISEVLQIGCRKEYRLEVVSHLFHHAVSHGAAALTGRLEPHFSHALSDQCCLLYRRKYHMLIHSRDPQIANVIHSGRAFISRLDGEWCLRFG
jgi:hypothetical protein